jgi:hypothetical protein
MYDEATNPPACENPKVLCSHACQLPRSTQDSELANLLARRSCCVILRTILALIVE